MIQATVRVPATSANLGPGFDSLGLALQLHNFVTVRDRRADDGETRVFLQGEDADFSSVPTDERNIAFIAAQLAIQHLGAGLPPFTLEMKNAIPPSRGLGSSSAARAGALFAANEWARLHGKTPLSPEELLSLCARLEGHPDNAAAALLGGLTVSATCEANASTRARVLQTALALRAQVERFPHFLVWVPDGELETKTARGALPDCVSRADAVWNLSRAALLLAALQNARFDLLPHALQDRLHEPYRAPLMPGFEEIKNAALQSGALGVTISGAGSSVLTWLAPRDASTRESVKSAVEAAAKSVGVSGRALELEADLRGCIVA